jgi:hypothetical protein
MASSIRDLNRTTDNSGDAGNRQVFTLSNGHVVALVRDEGTGGVQHFYIYESSDRSTWTLRLTVDMWGSAVPQAVGGTVDASDNLHIVALATGKQDLRYKKITYSGWSEGGWQQVESLTADNVINDFDIDVTDSGSRPYISTIYWNGSGSPYGTHLYSRITGSWAIVGSHSPHSGSWVAGCEAISVIAAPTTTVGGNTYDQVFMAFGYSQGKNDKGVTIYRPDVDTTTAGIRQGSLINSVIGTYAVGEGNPSSTMAQGRVARFFRHPTNTGQVYLGIMHAEVHRMMLAIRLNVLRANQDVGRDAVTSLNPTTPSDIGGRYMGMTASAKSLVFLYGTTTSKFPVKTIMNFTAQFDDTADAFLFGPRGTWFLRYGYIGSQSVTVVGSGGQRNTQSKLCDILFHTSKTDTNRHAYFECIRIADFQTPSILTPADGSDVTSSTPTVTARIKYATDFFQSQLSQEFQFDTVSGFTSPLSVDGNSWAVVDKVDSQTGADGIITGQVGIADAIDPNATIYMRARDIDPFGNTGPWASTISFTIAHPPSATSMIPTSGSFVAVPSSSQVMFKWTFSDPSSSDTQSAYQLKIIKNSDSSTILDTGKVTSSAQFALITIPSGHLDEDISWELTLWDSYDTQGPTSPRVSFKLEDAPTVTIDSPTSGSTVGTPVPHVQITVTVSGSSTIKSYRVTITQGRTTVWDSGLKTVSDASPHTYTVDGSTAVFHNLGSYTVKAVATDDRGFSGTSDPVVFSAAWTPPAMPTSVPTIDTSQYGVDGAGYIIIDWTDAGKDPDFALYVLQRQDNLIDPNTGTVTVTGEWKDITTIYENDTSYEYHDYMAPGTNYQVGYRLIQGATVFDDIVYSDPGPAAYTTSPPSADGYWLVDSLLTLGGGFQLKNVTADSYTEEYETETYHVVGRGNHTDTGDRLGYNGSINAQLRNTGGTTARQKKVALEQVKALKRPMYLRTPFGDVLYVSVGDIQVSRIAGVGVDEFVDVTIPYQEVGL